MWSPSIFVILAILVAVGYRRSLPKGAAVGWRDCVWVGSLVAAIGGAGLVGFIFSQSSIPWPDKVIAASVVGGIFLIPLAACGAFRLARGVE